MKTLTLFMSFIGLFVLILLLRLVMIGCGWDLFMTPVFGMRELTIWEALGLAILLPNPTIKSK